jgi:uncharacterized protein (DUF1330 family)
MSAYFVVRATVKDPVAFQEYATRSPGVIEEFGGRHIARGGKVLTFEGPQEDRRIVIAEFPDFDSAKRCYYSDAYQAIIPLRTSCSTVEFILVDGLPDSHDRVAARLA